MRARGAGGGEEAGELTKLTDEAFAGVFEQPRQRNWREVDP